MRVLVVDDDPLVTIGVAAMLEDHQVIPMHRAYPLVGPDWRHHWPEFDVLVCDLLLGYMDGRTVLAHCRSEFPDKRRVAMSRSDEELRLAADSNLAHAYVLKEEAVGVEGVLDGAVVGGGEG